MVLVSCRGFSVAKGTADLFFRSPSRNGTAEYCTGMNLESRRYQYEILCTKWYWVLFTV